MNRPFADGKGRCVYSGSNKIAIKSQRKLLDSLLQLMREKPLDSISVNEVCKSAKISRQTFYTLFESKSNAVKVIFQEQCPVDFNAVPEPLAKAAALDRVCAAFSVYVSDNRTMLRIMFQNDLDSIVVDSFAQALESVDGLVNPQYEHRRNLVIMFMAGGLAAVARSFSMAATPTRAGAIERAALFLVSQDAFEETQRL